MRVSGTHAPPGHVASALVSVPGGSCASGTQWAAPVVQQLGSAATCAGVGGVNGAAFVGVHVLLPVLLWACAAVAVPASYPVPASGVPATSTAAHAPNPTESGTRAISPKAIAA
jgi:hypothetical protein